MIYGSLQLAGRSYCGKKRRVCAATPSPASKHAPPTPTRRPPRDTTRPSRPRPISSGAVIDRKRPKRYLLALTTAGQAGPLSEAQRGPTLGPRGQGGVSFLQRRAARAAPARGDAAQGCRPRRPGARSLAPAAEAQPCGNHRREARDRRANRAPPGQTGRGAAPAGPPRGAAGGRPPRCPGSLTAAKPDGVSAAAFPPATGWPGARAWGKSQTVLDAAEGARLPPPRAASCRI